MKHPFKLSKVNLFYASIASVIIIFLNIRIYGFDAYTFGLAFGTIFTMIGFTVLIALLFWYLLGKKENGGTTTFNVLLTIMLLGTISEFSQKINDRQKPLNSMKEAVKEYKQNALANPDAIDSNYGELSSNVKSSIKDLIKTTTGEEQQVYLALQEFFNKSDSVNVAWSNAYNAFAVPRILDYNLLATKKEFDFQKIIIQEYIDQSINYKTFVDNRVEFLKTKTQHINKNHKAYIGFTKGFTKKDAIQKPVFSPYINAHIEYGQELKKMLEILEQEKGKWTYENETITFDNSKSENNYQSHLNKAIKNEKIVDSLYSKLIEVM
ncbi:hypothetical protein [uncultured Flavobacterium sp.]|uniref:hypothetical protein n=1 Tax=uncultured Flavobacterium sp. TaxID=165435 RepID=UPI0030EDE8C5